MSTKKTKPETTKPQRADNVPIHFYVAPDLAAALDKYIEGLPEDQQPTKKAIMVVALQQYLVAKKAWPLPDAKK